MNNVTKFNSAILLVRIIVGSVFLSEGIQKFLFPALRGAGRFIKIGLPAPEFLSYFVASFEIVCGLLILIGLFSRYAAVPLVIIMLVALGSTKLPIMINDSFWAMAHAARTDWSMLLGSIVLVMSGSGKYSVDHSISKKTSSKI